jgi:hypothetical protein
MEKDLQNLEHGQMDMSFVHWQYVQGEMAKSKKNVYPENLSIELEIELQEDVFLTPPSSENGDRCSDNKSGGRNKHGFLTG